MVPAWCRAREAVRRAILTDGFDDGVGAFTQSFGSPVVDASALMAPIVGFLPGHDSRVRSTICAVMTRLRDEDGFVRRYGDGSDGLEGREGAFVMCTFWLAHALSLAGELDEATEAFATATTAANDLGLMAEEFDARSGALLGNFPQAFSHVGLATAADAIAQASTASDRSAGEPRGNAPALKRVPGPCCKRSGTAPSSPRATTRSSSKETTTPPPEAVDRRYLRVSESRSRCPWKGTASYYSLTVDGRENRDAAWYYPEPLPAAAAIAGRIAFWHGVKVTASGGPSTAEPAGPERRGALARLLGR